MPNRSTPLASVETIAARLADEMGFEFIDIELVKEPAGRFLRVYIDDNGKITLDQLEAYHRKILPQVESVDYDYFEVSSPGVDRPIKKERDFERAKGTEVEVKLYKPENGCKSFEGVLVGLVDGEVVINSEGTEKRFTQKSVALVKPLIRFDESDLADIDEEEEDE